MNEHQYGFSLIELAIVLFILSLLLSTLLPPLSAQIEQKQREETQARLDEIKEVLYGFAFKNERLPCPDCRLAGEGTCVAADVDDGVEDRTGVGDNDCKSEVGNLPWTTLGVKGFDAWEQDFTYRVTDDFADDAAGVGTDPATCIATVGVSFALCSDGDLTILDSDGGANVATDVPAVVISHGRNWTETPSADEEENYDDSASATDSLKTFVYQDYRGDDANPYDDMLIWISPHTLRLKMLEAGILP